MSIVRDLVLAIVVIGIFLLIATSPAGPKVGEALGTLAVLMVLIVMAAIILGLLRALKESGTW